MTNNMIPAIALVGAGSVFAVFFGANLFSESNQQNGQQGQQPTAKVLVDGNGDLESASAESGWDFDWDEDAEQVNVTTNSDDMVESSLETSEGLGTNSIAGNAFESEVDPVEVVREVEDAGSAESEFAAVNSETNTGKADFETVEAEFELEDTEVDSGDQNGLANLHEEDSGAVEPAESGLTEVSAEVSLADSSVESGESDFASETGSDALESEVSTLAAPAVSIPAPAPPIPAPAPPIPAPAPPIPASVPTPVIVSGIEPLQPVTAPVGSLQSYPADVQGLPWDLLPSN